MPEIPLIYHYYLNEQLKSKNTSKRLTIKHEWQLCPILQAFYPQQIAKSTNIKSKNVQKPQKILKKFTKGTNNQRNNKIQIWKTRPKHFQGKKAEEKEYLQHQLVIINCFCWTFISFALSPAVNDKNCETSLQWWMMKRSFARK